METVKVREQDSSKRRTPSISHKLLLTFLVPGKEKQFYSVPHLEPHKGLPMAEALDRYIPFLSRVGPQEFHNMETGEILSVDEAAERYSDAFPELIPSTPEEPWFTELKKKVSVHLIDTDRLAPLIHRESKDRSRRHLAEGRLSVMRFSNDIARRIQACLAESAALTQALDRTFPARLVQQGVPPQCQPMKSVISFPSLRSSNQLKAVGLLDKADDMQFQVPAQMDESTKGVLAVYVQDVEKKLGVFDDLAARIKLFQRLVNDKFLFKQLSIDRDRGFVFFASDGTHLSPSDLSSGEQHELVLLYELLFRVQSNSLIMIDEPELSLHVAWQEQFLKDFQAITRLTSFDVLIATHSPQIIHQRWDLTVELSGPQE